MIADCPDCGLRHVVLDRAAGTHMVCECGGQIGQIDPNVSSMADGVFKCANCGGNPPTDATRCPYCDAHLTRQRCARCLAHGVVGDRHCRACGHEVGAPVPAGPRAPEDVLDCPRCDVALRVVLVGDVLVDECTRCSGLWLDHGAFEQVLSRTDFDKLVASIRALRPSRSEPLTLHARPETDERFYVGCPHCDVQMQRRQFGHISRVVIDSCHDHGMWFDKDELADIVAFVRDGGLQKGEDYVREQRMAAAIRAAKNKNRSDGSILEPPDFHGVSLLGIIEALLK